MGIISDRVLTMGPVERSRACIMIVDPDSGERANMRNCLRNFGFFNISDVQNHMAVFEKMEQRKFTHVIFDARPTNMPVDEFVKKVMTISPQSILIPSSYEPDVDDVFDLLILGARGYLVKPYTADSLDGTIVNATKGEPIADVVLNAKERNEALVAILMMSLDVLASVIKQSQKFETAQREIPKAVESLKRSSELMRTFAKGGADGYFESIEKFCIERCQGAATRLGRLRKRLHSQH